MPKLYVFSKESGEVVKVFACESDNAGDAAAGCEHAAGDEHYTAEFAWSFSAEGLKNTGKAPVVAVPPLSLAHARPETKERKRADLLAQIALLDGVKE